MAKPLFIIMNNPADLADPIKAAHALTGFLPQTWIH